MYNSARKMLEKHGVNDRALARRLLRDLARHGRLLDHADHARRQHGEALGRAGPHGGAALGHVRFADLPGVNSLPPVVGASAPRGRENLLQGGGILSNFGSVGST